MTIPEFIYIPITCITSSLEDASLVGPQIDDVCDHDSNNDDVSVMNDWSSLRWQAECSIRSSGSIRYPTAGATGASTITAAAIAKSSASLASLVSESPSATSPSCNRPNKSRKQPPTPPKRTNSNVGCRDSSASCGDQAPRLPSRIMVSLSCTSP